MPSPRSVIGAALMVTTLTTGVTACTRQANPDPVRVTGNPAAAIPPVPTTTTTTIATTTTGPYFKTGTIPPDPTSSTVPAATTTTTTG